MSETVKALGEVAKPVDSLINKISGAAGVLYEPTRIRRKAKAEADALIIATKAGIEATDLHLRAVQSLLGEMSIDQQNKENIIQKAIPLLEDNSKPEGMEDDWVRNFFDKARMISDDEMQAVWAAVLAGEANDPGSIGRRTVNFLATLSRKEAELFTKICGWAVNLDGHDFPLLSMTNYERIGASFVELEHLVDIGLLSFQDNQYVISGFPETIYVDYFDTQVKFVMDKNSGVDVEAGIKFGRYKFTQVGSELLRVCGAQPVSGFLKLLRGYMTQQHWVARHEIEVLDDNKTMKVNIITTKPI